MSGRRRLVDRLRRLVTSRRPQHVDGGGSGGGERTTPSVGGGERTTPSVGGGESTVTVQYAPEADGRPDPGEVVWSWIPYEDDPSQGKDRPCLVIGFDGDQLALVALTSRGGREDQVPVGTGGWDPQGRPSYAKLEHLYRRPAADVRREGSALPRSRFDEVIAALRARRSWPLDTDL